MWLYYIYNLVPSLIIFCSQGSPGLPGDNGQCGQKVRVTALQCVFVCVCVCMLVCLSEKMTTSSHVITPLVTSDMASTTIQDYGW